MSISIKSKRILMICLVFLGLRTAALSQSTDQVDLGWLGGEAPGSSTGVSWGVPFAKGEIQPGDQYKLTDQDGDQLPLQTWPLAFWPDGSVKWAGFSTVTSDKQGDRFILSAKPAEAQEPTRQLNVTENENSIRINTGAVWCEIPKSGNAILSSIRIGEEVISSGGRLVCILQNGPDVEVGAQPSRERFIGQLEKVTLEQNGPVRAVVKLEGKHVSDQRKWLPFVIRLYFYVDQPTIKMIHTIIYDGDQYQDFIAGLGVVFDVPMNEEVQNRHVRFSGEDQGFWDEPVKPLVGRRRITNQEGANPYPDQVVGKRVPNRAVLTPGDQGLLDAFAAWNDYKLYQSNADGFTIKKRTNAASAWIDAGAGGRSRGLAFVGDMSGGLSVAVKDFWQSVPSSLEIRNARTDLAEVRAWFWSPDGQAMDLRPYDTLAYGHGLEASYEDVQPGFSTPHGVARTSEILLFASPDVPSLEKLHQVNEQAIAPPLITASPEYMHHVSALGIWSLPDRSSRGKAWIEDQLDYAIEYYKKEIDARNWYGFWDYGDVMHAYDETRHVWRYDIGGYAWDNTELMPNMWLWTSYLRTGRKDIFRMAEAMTRHNSEVDVYHLGRFNGLGSRHNVRHWGDGSKEVRVSQAALNRYYYYLTTDERTGDLMEASVEASNKAIGDLDPLRMIMDKTDFKTRVRVGPDWLALAGNWMTAWERTGNTLYRDKIMIGVKNFSEMPHGFFTGFAYGYDPDSHELFKIDGTEMGYSHLAVLMGGPEVAYELTELLADPAWRKLWLQYCQFYGATEKEIKKEFGQEVKLGDPGSWYARLPAYYAYATGDQAYAKRAWDFFLGSNEKPRHITFNMKPVTGHEILEPIVEVENVSTNHTAQWCLNAIELLELIGDQIPDDHVVFTK